VVCNASTNSGFSILLTNLIGQVMFFKLLKDQGGAIFVEYALLATLIAVACVIAVSAFGDGLLKLFNPVVEAFQ